MLGNIKNWLCSHFDFRFYETTWINLVVALLIVPCVMFAPAEWGYENGILENIQMVVLFAGVFFALKSKIDKKFFIFVALVLTILILREVNCGRTLFFAIPGEVNSFYSWKEIKYGYLAHPIYGTFIASVGIYFLWNKLFLNLWDKIRCVKFPTWDMGFMLLGMALGLYAEEVVHNFVFEEITELLFYTGLIGIIYLYSHNNNFKKELPVVEEKNNTIDEQM